MHHGPIERTAPAIEVRDQRTYLQWLAERRGIVLPSDAHYGPEGIKGGHNGPIVLAMPGYGQSNVVEVEELDEAGNVLRSSRIGLKKSGALPWDRAKVREIAGKAATPPKGRRKTAAIEPKPAAVADAPHQGNETPSIGGIEPDTLAQQVAALADQVQRLQVQLDVMADAAVPAVMHPIGGMSEAIGGMKSSDADRARRLRIVRAYLRMRAQRNEARRLYDVERMIAADRMAAIWRVQDARKATIRMAMRMRQRRALDVAALEVGRSVYLDMERRALQAEERERGLMMESERRAATIAALRATPHHFGNEVRPDDLRRVTQDRDAARKALASAAEQRDRLAIAVDRGATMLDDMTERALRAEIALKAVEARRAREMAPTPYRVNMTGVSFEVAA